MLNAIRNPDDDWPAGERVRRKYVCPIGDLTTRDAHRAPATAARAGERTLFRTRS